MNLAVLSAPAAAVKVDPPSEIVVTGYRRPQKMGRAPAGLSLITEDSLKLYDDDLASAGALAPGLITTNLGPGRNKIFLRGLSDGVFTGRTQSTVGLYLDDAPITYDAPDPDLLLIDMAQIEVLKGPQGALYGEGSISGVVRLVPHKPDLSESSGFFSAGVGYVQGGSPDWRVAAMLNQPILKDRLGLRAVIYEDDRGGYIQDLAIDETHTNKTSRQGARIGLAWRISENWKLDAAAAIQAIDSRNSQYVSGAYGRYVRAVPIREPHDNDFSQIALTLNGDTALGALKISLNHLHHQRESQYYAQDAASFLPVPPAGTLLYAETQKVDLSTQEISFVSPSSRRLRWLGGFYSSLSRERFSPLLSDLADGGSLYSESRHDSIEEQALFSEISYDVTARLTLTAGLRASRIHHETTSLINEEGISGVLARSVAQELKTTHLSHIAQLDYQINDNLSTYILASEGYRSGGFNTTRLSTDKAIPDSYRGDELRNYEAGMKLALPRRNAHINLSIFRISWSDIQSDQIQPSGLPMTVNVGDGVNTGIEVESDWRLTDALEIKAAGQFSDPRLTRPNPFYVTEDDSGLPYISRFNANFGASWRTHFMSAKIETSALLSYRNASHLNFGQLQTVTMGGFATLDLASVATLGRTDFTLRLDNVSNTEGDSFAYGNPFSLSSEPQRTPVRPRSLWFGASIRF